MQSRWALGDCDVVCIIRSIMPLTYKNTTFHAVAFVRSYTDVGREGLTLSLSVSNSSQRCSFGLRSGLCAGQPSSFTPNSLIHVFMDLALCTGAQSCWNRKGPSPNCSSKVGSMELSNISWYAEAFIAPFSETKEPRKYGAQRELMRNNLRDIGLYRESTGPGTAFLGIQGFFIWYDG